MGNVVKTDKVNNSESLIVFFLPEKVDSNNVRDIEAKIRHELNKYNVKRFKISFADTKYISSAGLRMLLNIKRQVDEVILTEVDSVVYEILETTGLNHIFGIEKQLKQYSVDQFELIGRGNTASIYRVDEDTIIKVYSEDYAYDKVKREIEISRSAMISGVTTAIPYEIVKVGNQYGAIYELVRATMLSTLIRSGEVSIEECGSRCARFIKKMHSIEVDDTLFPKLKEKYQESKRELCPQLDSEAAKIFEQIIDAIPDGNKFIHGDFHPNNIMMQDDEVILIDMGETGIGSPIIDIMTLGCLKFLADFVPDDLLVLASGMNCTEVKKLWTGYLRGYFEFSSDEELKRIEGTVLLFASARALMAAMKYRKYSEAMVIPVVERMKALYRSESLDLNFLK